MSISIAILSIANLSLLVAVLVLSFKCVDLSARFEFCCECLKTKEEQICRIQNLVAQKFDYHVPSSDLYLKLEEEKQTIANAQGVSDAR